MGITLLIDGVDSTTYGFKYLRKEIGFPAIISYGEEWLKNSIIPLFGQRKHRYTPLSCSFLYQGTQNQYETMKSVFLDKIDKCTLKFSDIDFYYDVVFEGEDKISKINPEALEVGIKFSVYSKYKSQIVEAANRLSTKTINAIGNMMTPVIIEITPSIDLIDITISGLGDNFTIKNLKQGQKIVVNGEDGTVLQGGANKFMDTDMWEFPKLSPGTNSVTFSKNTCDVSIKYKPRWI